MTQDNEVNTKRIETLKEVSDQFVTRIPKALVQREARPATTIMQKELEPPSEDELIGLQANQALRDAAPPSVPLRTSRTQKSDKKTEAKSKKNNALVVPPAAVLKTLAPESGNDYLLTLSDDMLKKNKKTAPPRIAVPPAALKRARATAPVGATSAIKTNASDAPPPKAPLAASPTAPSVDRAAQTRRFAMPPSKTAAKKAVTKPSPKETSQLKATPPQADNTTATAISPPPLVQRQAQTVKKAHEAEAQNREIRIDLSASRSLTHLVCALAVNPGFGAEIAPEERRGSIQGLMEKSHELTDFICKKIKNNGNVPNYLYGSIFQEATRHVAAIWNDSESLDITPAQKTAEQMFNHESPLLDAFTYEAASNDGAQKLEPQARAELELQSALMGAMGNIRTTVLSMKIGKLIDGYGEQVEALREQFATTPYLFGQDDDAKIVTDLTKAAFRIAEENKINAIDDQMTSQWNVSMIYRAADLVKSEYEMFVERLVRASFSDLSLCEQTLNANNDMYEVGLKNIEKRAKESFNMISRTARRLALAPVPAHGEQKPGNTNTERDKP